METLSYDLADAVPRSATGVRLTRLEMAKDVSLPLALVWFTTWTDQQERGARIDLQKQAFLDDFGDVGRELMRGEAEMIVSFLSSLSTRQRVTAAMAGSAAMRRDSWR